MNVNKAIIVGRLVRDPEIRTTQSGQSVTSISLATNRVWKDANGQKQEQTEFHNIVLWGRLAEIAGQYLTKGQECYIEGRLQTRAYTGKDNIERRTTEIVAENMQLGTKPMNNNSSSYNNSNQQNSFSSQSSQNNNVKEDDIPTINLDEEQEEIKIEDVPF